MIRVNLLPKSHRKPPASSAEQLVRSPLALITGAVLAGLLALLGLIAQMRQVSLNGLQGRVQQVEPARAKVEALSASVRQLKEQQALLERIIKSRSQWARHLNQLSNVTPEGVWLTELSLNAEKGLVIQGSAIGQGGEEMVQIGRLAQDLKADATISSTIKDIQIQSIESVQEKDIEVIHFTLSGALAQPPGGGS